MKRKLLLFSVLILVVTLISGSWYTLANESTGFLRPVKTEDTATRVIQEPILNTKAVDGQLFSEPFEVGIERPRIKAGFFAANEYPREVLSDRIQMFPFLDVDDEEFMDNLNLPNYIFPERPYIDRNLVMLFIGSELPDDILDNGVILNNIFGNNFEIVNNDSTLYDINIIDGLTHVNTSLTRNTHLEIIVPGIDVGYVLVFEDSYFRVILERQNALKEKEIEEARIKAEKERLEREQQERAERIRQDAERHRNNEDLIINVIGDSSWGESGVDFSNPTNTRPPSRENNIGGSLPPGMLSLEELERMNSSVHGDNRFSVEWGVAENADKLRARQYYEAEKALMNTYTEARLNVRDLQGNRVDFTNIEVYEGTIQRPNTVELQQQPPSTMFYLQVVILGSIILLAFLFSIIAANKHAKLLRKERVRNRFKLEDDINNSGYMSMDSNDISIDV